MQWSYIKSNGMAWIWKTINNSNEYCTRYGVDMTDKEKEERTILVVELPCHLHLSENIKNTIELKRTSLRHRKNMPRSGIYKGELREWSIPGDDFTECAVEFIDGKVLIHTEDVEFGINDFIDLRIFNITKNFKVFSRRKNCVKTYN